MQEYIRDRRSPVPKDSRTSRTMSAIHAKNTKPELQVRQLLSQSRIRGYRLHSKLIAGKPDIAFTKKKVAVFVHGCYWHGCATCKLMPKTNRKFWRTKFERNKERDTRKARELKKAGWKVVTIWEHELKTGEKRVTRRLRKVLGDA